MGLLFSCLVLLEVGCQPDEEVVEACFHQQFSDHVLHRFGGDVFSEPPLVGGDGGLRHPSVPVAVIVFPGLGVLEVFLGDLLG